MRKALLLAVIVILIDAADANAHFERAPLGTRSASLGGVFVPLGDDVSTLFVNAAGLVNMKSPTLYGDFAEAFDPLFDGESRVGAVYPAPWFSVGVGWYRRGMAEGGGEDLVAAGIAKNLVTNAQGSFLAVGAAMKVGRVAYGPSCSCSESSSSETETTADLGIMFRPLPVISIGYSLINAREIDYALSETYGQWSREHRWGIAYFWEERVVLGFEPEHAGGRIVNRYGFAVRTSVPLEILAGFAEENVYGGIGWVGERARASFAFESDEENGVHARASVELFLRFDEDD
jgi:hypothetical protein